MKDNPIPTIHQAVQQIKAREQQELKEALQKYGRPTKNGYKFRFEDEGPAIAAYSNDEPCNIVVLSVSLENDSLKLYASENNGYNPRNYPVEEVFAGYLDYVTSELIYRTTKTT